MYFCYLLRRSLALTAPARRSPDTAESLDPRAFALTPVRCTPSLSVPAFVTNFNLALLSSPRSTPPPPSPLAPAQIAATAFLREFVDDTSDESDAHILIVCLWLAITLGRVIGLRDQLTLALARLFRHVTILCVGGTAAMVFLLFLYRFKPVVWVSVMVYGCFTGPALGYAYDLSTRVSPRPETSAMVAMFGITAGASIVPFLASFAWNVTGLAFFLPLFIVTSHAVPLVLLLETKRLHGVVSIRRSSQIDAASVATPTPTFGAPPSPTSCWSPAGSHFDEGSDDEEDRVVRERGAPEGVEMG